MAAGFLSRWSRRKAEERRTEARPLKSEPSAVQAEPDPPFDPDSLPPVESLTAESDITAFLRRGVPTPMRNAALRHAWATVPAIRNYRTLAEYDWDLNAPGYGALWPSDDIKALVDHVLTPRGRGRLPPVDPESLAVVEQRADGEGGIAPEAPGQGDVSVAAMALTPGRSVSTHIASPVPAGAHGSFASQRDGDGNSALLSMQERGRNCFKDKELTKYAHVVPEDVSVESVVNEAHVTTGQAATDTAGSCRHTPRRRHGGALPV